MKVRVCYTVEVSDEYRRALLGLCGELGLADRATVVLMLKKNGTSDIVNQCAAWREQQEMERAS